MNSKPNFSIVFLLTLAFALIAILAEIMPTIFENVLAQEDAVPPP